MNSVADANNQIAQHILGVGTSSLLTNGGYIRATRLWGPQSIASPVHRVMSSSGGTARQVQQRGTTTIPTAVPSTSNIVVPLLVRECVMAAKPADSAWASLDLSTPSPRSEWKALFCQQCRRRPLEPSASRYVCLPWPVAEDRSDC